MSLLELHPTTRFSCNESWLLKQVKPFQLEKRRSSALKRQNVDEALPGQPAPHPPTPEDRPGHSQMNMISSLPSSAIADTCRDTREHR